MFYFLPFSAGTSFHKSIRPSGEGVYSGAVRRAGRTWAMKRYLRCIRRCLCDVMLEVPSCLCWFSLLCSRPGSQICFMMNLHISSLRGDTHYWEALDLCLHFLSALIASRWEVFLGLAWECLLKLFSYWYSWFDTYQIWQSKDLMFGVILQGKHKWVIWPRRAGNVTLLKRRPWNPNRGPAAAFGFHYFF